MRYLMAAGLAFGALLPSAAAQAQPVVTNPEWIRRPTGEHMAAAWARAVKKEVSGGAVLHCMVTTTGSLRSCTVVEESPTGFGFGAAALLLAPRFLMKPVNKDGQPLEAEISIPISFRMPGSRRAYETDGAAWTAAPSSAQFEAAYPAALRGKNVLGTAAIRCGFAKDGSLRSCKLTDETPAGQGFGNAAKSLLPLFHADLSYFGDTPTGQLRVTLPFHFIDPLSAEWKQRTIPKPVWVRTASPEQVEAWFPGQARAAGLKTGRAVVQCVVDAAGALTRCTPNEETPPGMGFGQAAVTAAQAMAMSAWTQEGAPTEGLAITMPIRMNLPQDDAAKPPTKP